MLARIPKLIAILLMLGLICGCQAPRPYATAPPTDEDGIERNHGYALLYSTIESETQLDQVLMIKNARPAVAALLREITEFSKRKKAKLDTFAEADDSLGYDTHGLPHVEAKARDLITATTTRAIMLSGGRAFEVNILLTQTEALSYIAHLARALREMDDDADRRAFLGELAEQAGDLRVRVVEMIRQGPEDEPEDDVDDEVEVDSKNDD